MLKIGLTGGIGSGKSTVRKLFEQLGIQTLDADQIAKEIVEPGQEGLRALSAEFGHTYLTPEGTLNRQKLRESIFQTPNLKVQVEAILHPLIRESLLEKIAECVDTLILIEVPLLVETQADYLDYVIVTDCSVETQIERTLTRKGFSRQQVESIIKQQASRSERLKVADWVIHTDMPIAEVEQQVQQITEELDALSSRS